MLGETLGRCAFASSARCDARLRRPRACCRCARTGRFRDRARRGQRRRGHRRPSPPGADSARNDWRELRLERWIVRAEATPDERAVADARAPGRPRSWRGGRSAETGSRSTSARPVTRRPVLAFGVLRASAASARRRPRCQRRPSASELRSPPIPAQRLAQPAGVGLAGAASGTPASSRRVADRYDATRPGSPGNCICSWPSSRSISRFTSST